MKYEIQHPREIKSFIQATGGIYRTLSLEDYLFPVAEEPNRKKSSQEQNYIQSPMEIFASYSVFRLTLIEKGSDTQYVRANITLDDYEELRQNSADVNPLILKSRWKKKPDTKPAGNTTPSAYTQVLAVGDCKGQTPAQAILKDESNVHKLEYTALWLEERIDRHPNNKRQYDAIQEALQMYRDGQLCEDLTQSNAAASELLLFDSGLKTIDDPSRSDKRKLIYQWQLECTPDAPYPYRIRVNNYYAICNGIIPDESIKTGEKRVSINLLSKQWLGALEAMRRTREIYIRTYGSYELKRKNDYIAGLNAEE
jgi:hypothetical protein